MHDLVFRGATLVDGTGAPGRVGDLAVAGGRIAALGTGVGPGREEVAADGLVLAPGIIDTHTHYDAQITWDPGVTPSPELGVLSLEEAVWQLSGRAAEIFGIEGRARLRLGGAPRMTTPALGVHGVWVNGVKVADATGALADRGRPGRLLRDFAP